MIPSGMKKSGGDGHFEALSATAWSNQSMILVFLSVGLCAAVCANPKRSWLNVALMKVNNIFYHIDQILFAMALRIRKHLAYHGKYSSTCII